ncbi:hypothetical protein OG762_31390 [Streptomyces sp. NBC_01136]|uniref:hypothetical protein n=1 Tax=unclassified Streptomyces TaxID=2593676 RepID=UPI003252206B|nr:hypothetical protein OG762_31390 [Streptomyces sp. NBC_01136]
MWAIRRSAVGRRQVPVEEVAHEPCDLVGVRLARQARRAVRRRLRQSAARAQPHRYVDRAVRARERTADELVFDWRDGDVL